MGVVLVSAITNCPKLTGLKQHLFILTGGQKSENGSKIKVLAELYSFWRL